MNCALRATLLALCLLGPTAWAGPNIVVDSPWVREAPPGTSVSAAYMTLKNQGDEAAEVVGVSAREYARAELHETVHEGDNAGMRAVNSLTIPAGERISLEPGGLHLMLHEPDSRLEAGDWVTLMLTFDDGQLLEVTAPVKQRTGRESDSEQDSHGDHH